ncbi:hypothetical protein BLSTO_04203 [Blastocystis sp. subtype 1]
MSVVDLPSLSKEDKPENPFLKSGGCEIRLPLVQHKRVDSLTNVLKNNIGYNPFTRRVVSEPKDEESTSEETPSESDSESNSDDFVDDYLQRCQVKPAAVKSDDIDALFEHKMYRTIVSVFFPLPPNQIRSDYYSFLVQSYDVCYSLLQLNRLDDAGLLLDSCESIIRESRENTYLDALPGDSPMTSVKEMESLFELRCLLLHVFLKENACTEAMALLQRLFDCVGGKCSEDAFLLMKREEVAEWVEQLENVVIRSLLAQYSYSYAISLVDRWIDVHAQCNLPIVSLFLLSISIRLASGNVASLSLVEDEYTKYVPKEDDCLFLDYLRGVERMQDSCYGEAVSFFERVAGFSVNLSLQQSAVNNAAVCYYMECKLDKAAEAIEVETSELNHPQAFLLKNPEKHFTVHLVGTLRVIYKDLYPEEEW